ncbi:Uncharacterised protein [uncultured archaeon]|nr:Uncharacterised protein [uncultured archaeon]
MPLLTTERRGPVRELIWAKSPSMPLRLREAMRESITVQSCSNACAEVLKLLSLLMSMSCLTWVLRPLYWLLNCSHLGFHTESRAEDWA